MSEIERVSNTPRRTQPGAPAQVPAEPARIYVPGRPSWVPGTGWREDEYPRVPDAARKRVEGAVGEVVEWNATTDSEDREGPTGTTKSESWSYFALGTVGFARASGSRTISTRSGVSDWVGQVTVLPLLSRTAQSGRWSAPSPSGMGDQSGLVREASSGESDFDEGFRQELGHLPVETQRLMQYPSTHHSGVPQDWGCFSRSGVRDGLMVEERWCWIEWSGHIALAVERKSLPARGATPFDWPATLQAQAFDRAPWDARAWLVEIAAKGRICGRPYRIKNSRTPQGLTRSPGAG